MIQILPSVSAGQNLFFVFSARTQFGIGDHELWRPGNASGEEWIEKRSSGRHICGGGGTDNEFIRSGLVLLAFDFFDFHSCYIFFAYLRISIFLLSLMHNAHLNSIDLI